MYRVMKRDGQIADFALAKISVAIEKAFKAQDKNYNQDIIDLLALKVTAAFEPKVKESLVGVEDIQTAHGIGYCRILLHTPVRNLYVTVHNLLIIQHRRIQIPNLLPLLSV